MWSAKEARCVPAKYREIIADNLKKAGWSLGWVSAIGSEGQTIWMLTRHRGERLKLSIARSRNS
jgi:hypothetical protein